MTKLIEFFLVFMQQSLEKKEESTYAKLMFIVDIIIGSDPDNHSFKDMDTFSKLFLLSGEHFGLSDFLNDALLYDEKKELIKNIFKDLKKTREETLLFLEKEQKKI